MGKYRGDVKARVKAHTLELCAGQFTPEAQHLESKHFRCHVVEVCGEIVATGNKRQQELNMEEEVSQRGSFKDC